MSRVQALLDRALDPKTLLDANDQLRGRNAMLASQLEAALERLGELAAPDDVDTRLQIELALEILTTFREERL